MGNQNGDQILDVGFSIAKMECSWPAIMETNYWMLDPGETEKNAKNAHNSGSFGMDTMDRQSGYHILDAGFLTNAEQLKNTHHSLLFDISMGNQNGDQILDVGYSIPVQKWAAIMGTKYWMLDAGKPRKMQKIHIILTYSI